MGQFDRPYQLTLGLRAVGEGSRREVLTELETESKTAVAARRLQFSPSVEARLNEEMPRITRATSF